MANPTSISKEAFSGSTNGQPVKVAGTANPGTTIHTAAAGTVSNTFDEVWAWGYNSATVNRLLTMQWGGTATPDNDIKITLPSQSGAILLIPGWILQNSLVFKAYEAAAANEITISGYVNRITA